ncbi:MAG: carbon storage regulator, partial [Proteobacteria bacterium]|nr:carbon storage regulator [Pseudomonadota bacterium]
MLVLTRKPGEGFVIGDDITIKIVEMKGGGDAECCLEGSLLL